MNYNELLGLPKYVPGSSGYKGYSPIIFRPLNTVHAPRDIKLDTLNTPNTMCNIGKDFNGTGINSTGTGLDQKWCSEKNAVAYYAMRPIMQPSDYVQGLNKLFRAIVSNNNVPKGEWKEGLPNGFGSNIFCNVSETDIMTYILKVINQNVPKVPEFLKNGSWGIEQFHWTKPATFFNMTDANNNQYYCVLFNLYNPLRSTSTMIQVILIPNNTKEFTIVFMDIVNGNIWNGDVQNKSGNIIPYNLLDRIDVNVGGGSDDNDPMAYLFGNSLLDEQFNNHGFYQQGNNLYIEPGIPESIKPQVKMFEQTSRSYLVPSINSTFSGYVPKVNNGIYTADTIATSGMADSGVPVNAINGVQPIYEVPLTINKKGYFVPQKIPMAKPIGLVNIGQ